MRNASLRARSSGFLLTQKSDAKSKGFVKVPARALWAGSAAWDAFANAKAWVN